MRLRLRYFCNRVINIIVDSAETGRPYSDRIANWLTERLSSDARPFDAKTWDEWFAAPRAEKITTVPRRLAEVCGLVPVLGEHEGLMQQVGSEPVLNFLSVVEAYVRSTQLATCVKSNPVEVSNQRRLLRRVQQDLCSLWEETALYRRWESRWLYPMESTGMDVIQFDFPLVPEMLGLGMHCAIPQHLTSYLLAAVLDCEATENKSIFQFDKNHRSRPYNTILLHLAASIFCDLALDQLAYLDDDLDGVPRPALAVSTGVWLLMGNEQQSDYAACAIGHRFPWTAQSDIGIYPPLYMFATNVRQRWEALLVQAGVELQFLVKLLQAYPFDKALFWEDEDVEESRRLQNFYVDGLSPWGFVALPPPVPA